MNWKKRSNFFLVLVCVGSLLGSTPATSEAGTRDQTIEANLDGETETEAGPVPDTFLPPCPGGENLGPEKPLWFGPGLATCRAVPTSVGSGPPRQPVRLADDKSDVDPLHTSYHHMGAQTSSYDSVGIYGALNVADIGVTNNGLCCNVDFAVHRFLAKDCTGSAWIEGGWTEQGSEPDDPYVYSWDPVDLWQEFKYYSISPGSRIWMQVLHVGNAEWQTQLWWSGTWNLLASHSPGTDFGCGNEQYLEIYTDGSETYGGHPPMDTVTTGDGTSGGVQLFDASTGIAESWDSGISSQKDSITAYTTTWNNDYYSWYVDD